MEHIVRKDRRDPWLSLKRDEHGWVKEFPEVIRANNLVRYIFPNGCVYDAHPHSEVEFVYLNNGKIRTYKHCQRHGWRHE